MGEARETMDRWTAAIIAGDLTTLAGCYAADAVATTPDAGEVIGREAITNYFRAFVEAFPSSGYDYVQKLEDGSVAVDEGYVTGTNTGPLIPRVGESLPPTGKQIRLRSCDIMRVEGGLITTHHLYYDQLEFLGQLGLLPESLS